MIEERKSAIPLDILDPERELVKTRLIFAIKVKLCETLSLYLLKFGLALSDTQCPNKRSDNLLQ